MYLLTEWEGRTGKYLARGQDECVLIESQIFSRPVRPHSVNKYFIYFIFMTTFFSFSFFGGTRPRAAALLRFESSDFLSVASL